jgi:hypothetical protein
MAELFVYIHAPTAAGMDMVANGSAENAVGSQTTVGIATGSGTGLQGLGQKGKGGAPFQG